MAQQHPSMNGEVIHSLHHTSQSATRIYHCSIPPCYYWNCITGTVLGSATLCSQKLSQSKERSSLSKMGEEGKAKYVVEAAWRDMPAGATALQCVCMYEGQALRVGQGSRAG